MPEGTQVPAAVKKQPPWLIPVAGIGTAGVLFLWWRRRQAAAASSAIPASATSSAPAYYSTGNAATDNGSAYGSPLPVSVLPPITLSPQPSAGTTPTPISPPVTPTGPPQSPTVNQPIAAPPPAPTLQQAPPTPTPSLTNLPGDLLQKIEAGGERIVKGIVDPLTGGTWWLGSKGGIFAVGGARFLGSARDYGFNDPNVRSAADIQYLGNGYQVVSNHGEIYRFGG
jgi:hypothetical protein